MTHPPGSGWRLCVYTDAERRGGAEVNLSRVLAALPAHIQVTIMGVEPDVLEWLAAARPGSDRLVLPAIRDRTDLVGIARHRAMFHRLDAAVIQFNLSTASSCQWAIAAAATLRAPRLVVVENSPMAVWSSTAGRLKRVTSRRLAGHVAVGDRTARLIETSSGLAEGSIATIHHGVPAIVAQGADRPEGPAVLTVARHDPVKGIDVLLEALALTRTDVSAVVIGDGDQTDALNEQIDRLELRDRVELRSLPWEVRAADLMGSFDALVLPSRLEGFPVTVVEAMLAGTAVIATDVGSVREALDDGRTGWVVAPEDPVALAAAIDESVAHPELTAERASAALDEATQRFTMEATIDAYLEMYASMGLH